MLDHQLDVLLLVLLGDRDVRAVRLEVDDLFRSEFVRFEGKVKLHEPCQQSLGKICTELDDIHQSRP